MEPAVYFDYFMRNVILIAASSNRSDIYSLCTGGGTLYLGVPVEGTVLSQGDSHYYQVEVGAGEHLFVVLDAVTTSSRNELYIRYGQLPNLYEYDDKYDLPDKPDQAVEIANTQAGTYYILVYCSRLDGGYHFSYTIVAHNNTTMPTLVSGESVSGEVINQNDARYYQVEVGANEHLFVVLDAVTTSSRNELYIRYGQLPNLYEYDDKYDLPDKPDQAVEIANTQAGTYYILVYCSRLDGGYHFSYTITANVGGSPPGPGQTINPTATPTPTPITTPMGPPAATPTITPTPIPASTSASMLPPWIIAVIASAVAIIVVVPGLMWADRRIRNKRAVNAQISEIEVDLKAKLEQWQKEGRDVSELEDMFK